VARECVRECVRASYRVCGVCVYLSCAPPHPLFAYICTLKTFDSYCLHSSSVCFNFSFLLSLLQTLHGSSNRKGIFNLADLFVNHLQSHFLDEFDRTKRSQSSRYCSASRSASIKSLIKGLLVCVFVYVVCMCVSLGFLHVSQLVLRVLRFWVSVV
jgi:hypothetical protein